MPALALPVDRSFVAFTRDELVPAVRAQATHPAVLPESLSFVMFDHLSPAARSQYLRAAALTQTESTSHFKELRREWGGATVTLDQPATKLRTRTGEEVIGGRKNSAFAWSVAMALFEARRGFLVTREGSDFGLYFVPFNEGHLRMYTVDARDTFEDKTYEALCTAYEGLAPDRALAVARAVVHAAATGFGSRALEGLHETERRIVFDVIGIATAECYLRLVEKNAPLRCAAMIEATLVQPFLVFGGSVYAAEGETVPETRLCSHFFFFRNSKATRERTLRRISEHIRRKHPELFARFAPAEAGARETLFDLFATSLDQNDKLRSARADALADVLTRLKVEARDVAF